MMLGYAVSACKPGNRGSEKTRQMSNETTLCQSTEVPMLDELQAGHLRHILNLAARLPDDWSGMQGRTTLQEDFGSLRFQLAYMSYALALTHVHRLPAAPVMFRGAL